MITNTDTLKKYNIPTLEEWLQSESQIEGYHEGASVDSWCRLVLSATDHIPNKLVEGSLKTEDCADELYWREVARQELAKLNGEETPDTVGRKTLEQRVTDAEESMENAVSYDEMQTAIMEGVNEV